MIGIIGYGVIGKTTHQVLFPTEDVKIHDVVLDTDIMDLLGSEIIFVCTPTNCNANFLEIRNIIELFTNKSPETEVVIRSTAIPGFFNGLKGNVTYLPEFLRERNAIDDARNSKILFYSTNLKKSKLHNYDEFNFKLKKLKFSELEILKLMSNNYHAMKVVFANHYYDICQKYDADYDVLLDSFYKSKNGQSYMNVNENLRGYGGKCLPKDIDFAIDTFNDCNLFQSIKKDNQKWKTTLRDDI